MSVYNCHFELIIQVEDPNGIHLNERMVSMLDELNQAIREKHSQAIILPRGFEIMNGIVEGKEWIH